MVTSFFIRRIFTEMLGLDLVGIDGRFSEFVSILAVVELGLGTGMIYKLYEPISKKNWIKVSSVLKFLKNSYFVIMILLPLLGILFAFFMVNTIRENFSKIWLLKIFFLYVIDAVCSYIYFHKRVMIIADQKSRITNVIKIFCTILIFFFQIFLLKIFKSFELYLIIKIIFRIIENFIVSYKFNKNYYFLDVKNASNFDKNEKIDIIKNIKAMLFHKIGGASLRQISTIVISLFISLRESGIYYNYMLIISALWGISFEFFNSVMASFGNLLNTENKEKIEENFNALFMINFFIYSFFCSAFFTISEPFMKIWITSDHSVFKICTVVLIVFYLYVYGMRQCIDMAKTSAGIYIPDRYFPILECITNLLISFFLAKKFFINGILIGNILTIILISFFSQPFFLYKIIFNKKPWRYYKKYIIYTFITVFEVLICHFCVNLIHLNSNILQIAINFILCLIIPNSINIMLFHGKKEFSYIKKLVVDLKSKF